MRGIKRWVSIMLLAVVVGLGTPAAVLADGNIETPGLSAQCSEATESTLADCSLDGNIEVPGFLTVIGIYLSVSL